MALIRGSGNPQRDLNHMAPAASAVRLGDVLNDIITNHNALVAALVAAQGAVLPTLTGNAAAVIPSLGTARTPQIAGDYPN